MIPAALPCLWVLTQAQANDPFAGPDVRVEVVDGRWRIDVRGRVLEVDVPTTDDERALIAALVESLLADLRLPKAPAVAPPPPVDLVAPRPREPASPPEAAPEVRPRPPEGAAHAEAQSRLPPLPRATARALTPTADRRADVAAPALPELRWHVWIAGSGAARRGVAPSLGPTVGVALGRRAGGRVRATVDLPRGTSFADDSSLSALQLDAAAWWALGPVRFEVGPGVSWRTFRRQAGNLTRVPTPLAVAGIGAVAQRRRFTLAPWIGGTLDAAVTIIDADGANDSVFSPVALWAELRVGWTP